MPKSTSKNKPNLEHLLEAIIVNGPRVVQDFGIRLHAEDAIYLSQRLHEQNIPIEAYDFKSTINVWNSHRWDGTFYPHHATKQLIRTLSGELDLDYRTIDGFRKLLPHINTKLFYAKPINKWGTKLGGMLVSSYEGSPSAAVIDLVEQDDDFIEIRKVGLNPYDFNKASQNIWTDKQRTPTDVARRATKELLRALAKEMDLDYTAVEGLSKLLPRMTANVFETKPINVWGTKLGGMLQVYEDSPGAAISNLFNRDPEFAGVRQWYNTSR